MLSVEETILNSIIHDENYFIEVFTKIKPEYFHEPISKQVFKRIKDIVTNHNTKPNLTDLMNYIQQDKSIKPELLLEYNKLFNKLNQYKELPNSDLLKARTKTWAEENALKDFLINSMSKLDSKNFNRNEIIEKFEEVISIDFDNNFGTFVFNWDDAEKRFPKYRAVNMIKSGFQPWDEMTGGHEGGTLTAIQAPINGGKSLTMAFLATCFAIQGYNVVYFSMEMSEEKIAMRNEVNLIDIETKVLRNQLDDINLYKELFDAMKQLYPNAGDIYIKQYPSGHPTHIDFKNHLKELSLKKNYRPNIIFWDYLGICNTTKNISFDKTYAFQKAIGLELRGLVIELSKLWNIPVFGITAMQVTGDAMKKAKKDKLKADIGMDDAAGSIGVPQDLDGLVTQIEIPRDDMTEFLNLGVDSGYLWINSKTRNDSNKDARVLVGVNFGKMKLIQLNQSVVDDSVVLTKSIEDAKKEVNDYFLDEAFKDI